jgi:5-(carboxyamino)imidazole ribonucleotide synthase
MKIGVLGAGQLGRMLALAGIPLGIEFVFYDNKPQSCAAGLGKFICAEFSDQQKLSEFADQVDVITLETENVPIATLEFVINKAPVFPGSDAVAVTQDRIREKEFFNRLGIPTARYFQVDTGSALRQIATQHKHTLMIKSRRFGYDGKGQMQLDHPDQANTIWQCLGQQPLIAEQRIAFNREVSIISVRRQSGEMCFYPLVENYHLDGILFRSHSQKNDPRQALAEEYAQRVMQALNYVGVLTIEFFDCDGELVANEIAPRVHNSGHWSIDAATTSQFENHLRAILNLPLGETSLEREFVMYNIISRMPDKSALLAIKGLHLHDYAKSSAMKRKLGHITLCNPTEKECSVVERILVQDEPSQASYLN